MTSMQVYVGSKVGSPRGPSTAHFITRYSAQRLQAHGLGSRNSCGIIIFRSGLVKDYERRCTDTTLQLGVKQLFIFICNW